MSASKKTQTQSSAKQKTQDIHRTPTSPRPNTDKRFTKPSLTKQSFADEVDINNIMARFTQTGVIDHVNSADPNFGYAPSSDFRESLELVKNAHESFADLPAGIRRKFNNDPEQFLAFVEVPENRPQMASMGLLTPEATQLYKDWENRSESKPDPSTVKDPKKPTSDNDKSE